MAPISTEIVGLEESTATVIKGPSFVARVTYAEEAIIIICVLLLLIALVRCRAKPLLLLLTGFVLMPARDIIFHIQIYRGNHGLEFYPEGLMSLASLASFAGWLFIAAYCFSLMLAQRPRIGDNSFANKQ